MAVLRSIAQDMGLSILKLEVNYQRYGQSSVKILEVIWNVQPASCLHKPTVEVTPSGVYAYEHTFYDYFGKPEAPNIRNISTKYAKYELDEFMTAFCTTWRAT